MKWLKGLFERTAQKEPPWCEDCFYFNDGRGCLAPGNRRPIQQREKYVTRAQSSKLMTWVPVPKKDTSIPKYIKAHANKEMKIIDNRLCAKVPAFEFYWSSYSVRQKGPLVCTEGGKLTMDRKVIYHTIDGVPLYGPEATVSKISRSEFPNDLTKMVLDDRFRPSLEYRWSEEILKPDHSFNWAGVTLGLCSLLLQKKIKFSRKLVRSVPKDWRPELIKFAIMRVVKED